jgi:hypothetical protein
MRRLCALFALMGLLIWLAGPATPGLSFAQEPVAEEPPAEEPPAEEPPAEEPPAEEPPAEEPPAEEPPAEEPPAEEPPAEEPPAEEPPAEEPPPELICSHGFYKNHTELWFGVCCDRDASDPLVCDDLLADMNARGPGSEFIRELARATVEACFDEPPCEEGPAEEPPAEEPPAEEPPGATDCSPGYYKSHTEVWFGSCCDDSGSNSQCDNLLADLKARGPTGELRRSFAKRLLDACFAEPPCDD